MASGEAEAAPQEERLLLLEHDFGAPADAMALGYLAFFVLGAGFLLPWNAFITAVDYFSDLYPGVAIDAVFAVAYLPATLLPLFLLVVFVGQRSAGGSTAISLRINVGLVLFTLSLLVVPLIDAFYVRGRTRVYSAFDATVAATVVCGLADALVQSGVIGLAGELPGRYMQAVEAGTGGSGVLVSLLRIFCKALFPDDLRTSAMLYFIVGIILMAACIVCYNVVDKLPLVEYYKNIKRQAVKEGMDETDNAIIGSVWRSTLWDIIGKVKWFGFGVFIIYVVTLSIFPGYITADLHSEVLGDWYPIILITAYNVFDLIGKSLPAVYLLRNADLAVSGSVARLLFYPLFWGCLHGPEILRTEIPVTILTCLLGLSNGYLTCVLMILAPKTVPIQRAEAVGIVLVLSLCFGLVVGSVIAWFWVI